MSFLTISFDKQFIYVIIYWILEILLIILKYYHENDFKIPKNSIQREYLYVILSIVGELLSGFLILYTKYASKSQRIIVEKKEDIEYDKNQLIFERDKISMKNISNKKITFIGLIDFISRSLFWIVYSVYSLTNYKEEQIAFYSGNDLQIAVDIPMRYIFSIFILKMKIYKHSIVSLIMIFCGLIMLICTDMILCNYSPISKSYGATMIYSGILMLRGFSIPYEHVLIKKIFYEKYIFPQVIIFYRACIEAIILSLTTPILYFLFYSESNIEFDPSFIVYLIFIFYIFKEFINSYIRLNIIYRFSIQSVSFLYISLSLGCSIIKIIDYIKSSDKTTEYTVLLIIEIIGILTIFTATLIYDEIIIVNKWGLNENVKLNISKRGEEDIRKTLFEIGEDSLLSN
jgi:hypothetical protein